MGKEWYTRSHRPSALMGVSLCAGSPCRDTKCRSEPMSDAVCAPFPQNDLTFLRIRSKKHEIMVAPDKEYVLIVIQNPHAD